MEGESKGVRGVRWGDIDGEDVRDREAGWSEGRVGGREGGRGTEGEGVGRDGKDGKDLQS